MKYDFIIAGAGLGGLTSGLILQQKGFKVLILESHTKSGGCASNFKRFSKINPIGDFAFDVGATTLSGFNFSRPLFKFSENTGLYNQFKNLIQKQNIGLIVHLVNGEKIFRYADFNEWIDESVLKFCENQNKSNQNKLIDFWKLVYKIESLGFSISEKLKKFPPKKISDFLKLPKSPNNLSLLYYLFSDTHKILNKFNLTSNHEFMKFVEQQLLITFQAPPKKVPFLFACMGLAYPSDTYYIKGGMYKFSKIIEDEFIKLTGEIKFKHKVNQISVVNNIFNVNTNKGIFQSDKVISNISIWNIGDLISDSKTKTYYAKQKNKFKKSWGAFTVYLAVSDNFDDLGSLYHQIHFQSKTLGYASVFVSLSMMNDTEKAPVGWRTISVSTHIDNPETWFRFNEDEYKSAKSNLEAEILEVLKNSLPGFDSCIIKYKFSGTPKTFEFFTKRFNGFVGGIPSDISKNIFGYPSSFTPLNNFYMVGDSVFPGQGSPAIVSGAMNLTELIS